MRELSDAQAREQAEQFSAWASRRTGATFDAWASTKDLSPEDRGAVLLAVGDLTLGIALPKPPRRGPKPRKPIARKARPRAGNKSKAPRRKLDATALELWSLIVRSKSPTCVSPRFSIWRETGIYVPCGQPTAQAAHGYDRGEYGTRYDTRNGWPSCVVCNCYTYARPRWRKRLWYAFVEREWGPELTAHMRAIARRSAKDLDLHAIIRGLEDEWARVKGAA